MCVVQRQRKIYILCLTKFQQTLHVISQNSSHNNNFTRSPPQVKLQFQYMHTVETSYQTPDSRRLSLTGVFFINENDNVVCFIATEEEGLTIITTSTLTGR